NDSPLRSRGWRFFAAGRAVLMADRTERVRGHESAAYPCVRVIIPPAPPHTSGAFRGGKAPKSGEFRERSSLPPFSHPPPPICSHPIPFLFPGRFFLLSQVLFLQYHRRKAGEKMEKRAEILVHHFRDFSIGAVGAEWPGGARPARGPGLPYLGCGVCAPDVRQ